VVSCIECAAALDLASDLKNGELMVSEDCGAELTGPLFYDMMAPLSGRR
jgi:hypothetical protein